MHESPDREHERESKEAAPMPLEIQRKEPHELSWPSKDYNIPRIEEVQQEKERERSIHALEVTTSKEEKPAQVNQVPSPSSEILCKEPSELEKFSIKGDGSKAESLVQTQEGKESIHSIEETTTTSQEAADELDEPLKLSGSSSTQQFEQKNGVGSKQSEDSKDSKIDESHAIHEIEEEKAYGKGDEASKEESQVLEEQKEYTEEAIGRGKDNKKRPKKLFVSLIIAASALLFSGIFFFIWQRRSRKSVFVLLVVLNDSQSELKFTLHINIQRRRAIQRTWVFSCLRL
ncbi:hypothetical protein RJT34_02743 [Clitoria ternatea]|uniref:Uncharacterized protein n=1 Tax=Clitoria ternatea TaxID=43366 RepID=A0AAN9KJH2_CLITE